MYLLLPSLWLVWEIKYVLFWLYLWQLKDYHTGRFADHFRTHKGQKIFFNFTQALKLALLILFLIMPPLFSYLFSILFLAYLFQSLLFLRGILAKSIKKPSKTVKIIFLAAASFAIVVLFLARMSKLEDSIQPAALLAFDLLTPLMVSAVVLFFQPFFVLLRSGVLRKAKDKIQKIQAVSGLKVIAVTGSYGKTSTKEFLTTILSKKFKVLSTEKHQNSEIGVAKCILKNLKTSHQILSRKWAHTTKEK